MTNNKINKPEQNEENKTKKKGGFSSWWKNLGKGGRIALCALAGAGVTTAAVVPTVIAINNNKQSIPSKHIAKLYTSNVEITEQKTLDNGDLQVTFNLDKTKRVFGIVTSVIVRNKNQQGVILKEGTDYTVDSKNGIVLVKHDSFKNYTNETIEMSINVTYVAKTTKAQFITVNNLFYADFNKATTEYPKDKVTCKIYSNGAEKIATIESLYYDVIDGNRFAMVISQGISGNSWPIAAESYADNKFYESLKDETEDGVEYTITADEITYVDTKAKAKEASRISFNKYGYLTSMIEMGDDGKELGISFTYSGEPQKVKTVNFDGASFTTAVAAATKGSIISAGLGTTSLKENNPSDVITINYSTTGVTTKNYFNIYYYDENMTKVIVQSAMGIEFSNTQTQTTFTFNGFDKCSGGETLFFEEYVESISCNPDEIYLALSETEDVVISNQNGENVSSAVGISIPTEYQQYVTATPTNDCVKVTMVKNVEVKYTFKITFSWKGITGTQSCVLTVNLE